MKLKKFIKDINKAPLKIDELAEKIREIDDPNNESAIELAFAASKYQTCKEYFLSVSKGLNITIAV